MAATAAVAGVVVAAGSEAYNIHSQREAAEKAGNLLKPITTPKLPDTGALANSLNQADIQAKTAGGTILSNQRQNSQIGDGSGLGKKTLLGA